MRAFASLYNLWNKKGSVRWKMNLLKRKREGLVKGVNVKHVTMGPVPLSVGLLSPAISRSQIAGTMFDGLYHL